MSPVEVVEVEEYTRMQLCSVEPTKGMYIHT